MVLELAILGLLTEQDLHGYELKKQLGDTLGLLSGVSFGSLYPALNRLERSGAVTVVDRPAAPARAIPATGSLGGELAAFRARAGEALRGGRARKVYAISEAGRALFNELLSAEDAPADDDRTFHLRWAFARHLSPNARLGLLERRRAQLVERLARARQSARRRELDRFARSLADHGTETTERDINWLDGLIAYE